MELLLELQRHKLSLTDIKDRIKNINDINFNIEGNNFLLMAIKTIQDINVIKYLINSGIDLGFKDNNGYNCLFNIGIYKPSLTLFKHLKGKNINFGEVINGDNIIDILCRFYGKYKCGSILQIMTYLVSLDEINNINMDNDLLLQILFINNNIKFYNKMKLFKLLIKKNIDINFISNDYTLLDYLKFYNSNVYSYILYTHYNDFALPILYKHYYRHNIDNQLLLTYHIDYVKSNEECCICCDIFNDGYKCKQCNNILHLQCINMLKKYICPLCRGKLV